MSLWETILSLGSGSRGLSLASSPGWQYSGNTFSFFFVCQELKDTDDIFLGISNIVLVSRSILVLLDLLHFPYATSRFAGICYKKPEWKKVHFC